ncbi:MAG: LL-diaminopimelate aminotransferase [Alphaproteobacteria bacterium]|nr:LL-diaminopimelate aminotransferase [Alphaproteobacteria bacterium]
MITANNHYFELPANYLFQDIAKKIKIYKEKNPNAKLISLGIGDVTQPIPMACVEAMHKACDEMGKLETMRGYGPEQGYEFLRQSIVKNDYLDRNIEVAADEIFVSDGSKCDVGNIQEIFDVSVKVAIPDPVYPVYRDTNIMAGRKISYLPCLKENNFLPSLPDEESDLIYLCSPNNPTGTVMTKDELKIWVDYAREHHSIIIFDSAYKEYIRTPGIPHSIYEISGAKEVAIELRSFSKTAGFTGVRCAYMVIPHELKAKGPNGEMVKLNPLWSRRHSTKFNGVAYIVQRAAEAVFSEEGKKQVKSMTDYYMENAKLIREKLTSVGLTTYGGKDAPYIWLETPRNITSVDLFEKFLNEAEIVCTPGSGFGQYGEGFVRLTSFGTRENTIEALNRIGNLKL